MSFTAIGDVDQLLYRFAGSKPEVLSDSLEEYFGDLLTFMIETNYRSTQLIVDKQKESIANNYSDRGGPYKQNIFKRLTARLAAPQGLPFDFQMFDTQQDEAEHVADSIQSLVDSGDFNYGDFFVGSRTRSQLGYIEGALTRRGIKYVNLAGGCFWSSKHVQDVVSYAKLAYNETDEEAFKRVYNIASRWFKAPFGSRKNEYINHRYLGREFIDSVRGSYTNVREANWRYRAGVVDMQMFVQEIQSTLESSGIGGAIGFIVDNCYMQWLAAEEGLLSIDESENGKLDDLRTVMEIASQFENPDDFFTYVSDMEKAAQDIKNGDHSKFVVISTIHRLKGKERPVVFGIGICEGQGGGYLKQPCGLLPHTFSLTNPPNFGVLPTGGKGRIEDERCVFFVLISRAKERVYLSGVRYFRDFVMQPSRFVYEIGLVEKVEKEKEEKL